MVKSDQGAPGGSASITFIVEIPFLQLMRVKNVFSFGVRPLRRFGQARAGLINRDHRFP
jgi:hypothetical protein